MVVASQQSYCRLAEQFRLLGAAPAKDARELWQRMVFNILCNNNDDPLRNHGFLWDGKGWRLAPGYDIVPFPRLYWSETWQLELEPMDAGQLCITL